MPYSNNDDDFHCVVYFKTEFVLTKDILRNIDKSTLLSRQNCYFTLSLHNKIYVRAYVILL